MKKKVAINGFGRIGRCAFRSYLEKGSDNIEIVGINGIRNPEEGLFNFIHDSIYGKFEENIEVKDDYFL